MYYWGMVIRFSKHAKDRLRERKINKELVKTILNNPYKIKHIEGDKFLCYGKDNNGILTIVFIKQKELIKVITAYYENHI